MAVAGPLKLKRDGLGLVARRAGKLSEKRSPPITPMAG